MQAADGRVGSWSGVAGFLGGSAPESEIGKRPVLGPDCPALGLILVEMGPFTMLSIVGKIFPRLLAILLVVCFFGFPHLSNSIVMWAVHVEAAQITSLLDRVFAHVLRARAVHDCTFQVARCTGHIAHTSR